MAGSYNHAVSNPKYGGDGQLLKNAQFAGMIENIGDAYEMAEEMYGMIWYLATMYSRELPGGTGDERADAAKLVEEARDNYERGLEFSPGTNGEYDDDE